MKGRAALRQLGLLGRGPGLLLAALLASTGVAQAVPPEPGPAMAAPGRGTAAPGPATAAPAASSAVVAAPAIDVVVTGTRTNENARRSPVRVDVVTRAEAERRGATNVGEALAYGLGTQVNPSAYGALGRPSAVQIGGLDRDRVLVLEDGERVVGDKGGAIDLAQIPLADVARIETVQGPASALYGSSAIGGVVNVITAPPELEGPSGNARVEWRSPVGVLALGSAAFRSGEHWVQADGSLSRGNGVALDPELPDLAAPSFTRGFAGLRAGTQLAPGARFTAKIRFSRDREDGLQSQEVPGLGRYLSDLPETSDRFSVRLRQTVAVEGGHEIAIALAKQWFWSTSSKDRRNSPVDDDRERSHTMHSGEATASLFAGRSWSGLAGVRFEAERFAQTLRRIEARSDGLHETVLPEVPLTSLARGALFGQVQAKLGGAWTALAGLRLEGSSRYGAALAPSLAVAFAPSERLVLRAHAGRGYRAPSAKELGFVFDHSVYGYRVIGNPALGPETSWGIGADVEVSPVRAVRLRGSVFANWLDEMIDLRLAPVVAGGPAGVDTYTYSNIGAARTAGVSLDASLRASSWLRADAGWSYLFTRDESAQRPLPGRPPHTLQAGVFLNLPHGIEALARTRFVTDAYLDEGPRAPGFATVDARVAKALGAHLRVYAGALNLLGVQKDPHRAGDTRPVEGRTFYVGAGGDFPWES